MSGDCHYRAVAGLRLRKFGDGVVPQIMKSQTCKRALHLFDLDTTLFVGALLRGLLLGSACRARDLPCEISPYCPPTRLRLRRIYIGHFASREDIMVRLNLSHLSGTIVEQ